MQSVLSQALKEQNKNEEEQAFEPSANGKTNIEGQEEAKPKPNKLEEIKKDFEKETKFNRWVKILALLQLGAFFAIQATLWGKMSAREALEYRLLIGASQDSPCQKGC